MVELESDKDDINRWLSEVEEAIQDAAHSISSTKNESNYITLKDLPEVQLPNMNDEFGSYPSGETPALTVGDSLILDQQKESIKWNRRSIWNNSSFDSFSHREEFEGVITSVHQEVDQKKEKTEQRLNTIWDQINKIQNRLLTFPLKILFNFKLQTSFKTQWSWSIHYRKSEATWRTNAAISLHFAEIQAKHEIKALFNLIDELQTKEQTKILSITTSGVSNDFLTVLIQKTEIL